MTSSEFKPVQAFRFPAALPSFERLFVSLLDLQFPETGVFRGELYLVPEGVAIQDTQDFRESYRIEIFGNFPKGVEHHAHARKRLRIDVTNAVRRVQSQHPDRILELFVKFVDLTTASEPKDVTLTAFSPTYRSVTLEFAVDGLKRNIEIQPAELK